MTRRDTSGDDAWKLMTEGLNPTLPMTLEGWEVALLRRTLEETQTALRLATTSKVGSISRNARIALADVERSAKIIKADRVSK